MMATRPALAPAIVDKNGVGSASRPFWDRIRAVYPGEYLLSARQHVGCTHLLF